MNEEKSKVHKSECSKYDKSKKDILDQKEIVEKLVQELLNELDDNWKNFNLDLERKQNEVEKMEKKLHEQNIKVDKLVKWKDCMPCLDETKKLERLLCDDVIKINIKPSHMPRFFPREVTKDSIGTLKIMHTPVKQETKIEFKVVRNFTTDLQNIHFAEACSDGSLWIGDGQLHLLQHIQIKRNKIDELLRVNTKLLGIAVTSGNELILISNGESTVKQVNSTGKMTDSQYSVAPLVPYKIHVTSSNTVIIGAKAPGPRFPATGRRVVILMDQKGNYLVEHALDSNNKPLFTFPRSITSTSEGNICVVDRLESHCQGRVVVLSPTGDVINTYSGHYNINNMEQFKPADIITTALNNILVVDNYGLHVLDSEGHFITYYSTKDLGIILPYSVAVSTTGNLFIGSCSSRDSADTFKSKLHEIKFTGF